MITCYQAHTYTSNVRYIHLFEMLRSRDRSIAARSSRKNFSSSFDQSLRLVNFSVLRVELIRLRCSVSLSILKVTVLRKLCFTAKTIVLYTSPIAIWYPLLYLRMTGPIMQARSIDWSQMIIYRRGRKTINLIGTYASHNQSANVTDLSRYVSHKKHKLEIINNQFFGRIRRAVFF